MHRPHRARPFVAPLRLLALGVAFAASSAAAPPDPVAQALAAAGPGTRIGLLVVDQDGREVVAVRADERFVPASNTKLFITAAAMATLDTAAPDAAGGAAVRLEGRDVVLVGHGDARLSSAPDCTVDCLADLARAVAARTRVVRDVIGDDSAFPDERWPAGMSWNNMVGRYGTAASALTLDDNVTTLTVRAAAAGRPAMIVGDGYYQVVDRVTVVAGGTSALTVSRLPGTRRLRIDGTIPAGSAEALTVGIDDPAHFAAWRFVTLLKAAGVRVKRGISVRHAPVSRADLPETRADAAVSRPDPAPPLARLVPPPLLDDVRITMKVSQNLHAELLLRRVGAQRGTGAVADGQMAVGKLLDSVGIPRWQYDFADGSGMSSYNRITPRAAVRLLQWSQSRPWGAAWRATFPVAGVDGTLARRFRDTPLQSRLYAKTGTLNAANALSGFMVAASGRTLIFSALANDMPGDASATAAIDRALLAVAATH
jgi:D-alanyl-D-alanine carboxypeptidase/D-alanyl-D-alanine-endopeptidase (penicillin-binding protein 4)